MRVLITGGAGFLGLHTCRGLLERGYDPIALDIAPFDPSEYEGIETVRGDVRDFELMKKLAGKVDAIIHAAAALPLWPKREIWDVNVNGTRTVLQAALEAGVERVVYISTTAVYGLPKKVPIREDFPLDKPVGEYGKSKVAAERVCEEFRQKGLVIPILRPKTFIGPERLGIFSIFFEWVKEGRKIPMIGKGNNKYQLLDVSDLVDAIILCLEEDPEKVNDVFNVGAERFGTVREQIQALCDHAGTGARPIALPAKPVKFVLKVLNWLKLSPIYEWAYGTLDKDSYVDITKIKKKLGWRPKYSNEESLIRTYDWFIEHYDEIKSKKGVTHRVMWKEGILALVKRFF